MPWKIPRIAIRIKSLDRSGSNPGFHKPPNPSSLNLLISNPYINILIKSVIFGSWGVWHAFWSILSTFTTQSVVRHHDRNPHFIQNEDQAPVEVLSQQQFTLIPARPGDRIWRLLQCYTPGTQQVRKGRDAQNLHGRE